MSCPFRWLRLGIAFSLWYIRGMIGHGCRRIAYTRSAACSQARRRGLIAGVAMASACSAVARSDVFARFDIWVEAPAVVEAGDIVDVRVWAQLSGPVLDIGLNAMAGFNMDLPVNASGNLVSEVENPRFGHPFFNRGVGEVNTAGIFDILAFQLDIWDAPIFLNNPILLYSTRLHMTLGQTGWIELVPERNDPTPSIISWWVDIDDPSRPAVIDTDPNAELHIGGATIRVVPAPTCAALLALSAFGFVRRRR